MSLFLSPQSTPVPFLPNPFRHLPHRLQGIVLQLPAGKLSQGGGQVVKPSRSPPEDQVTVIRISSIQSNVLLLDCKIKGVPVTAVVDCGSPICILSDKVFKCIAFNGALGKVGSKVLGAEGSQLNILGTVELDMAFKRDQS